MRALLYKHDIPVGFPPGISSQREDGRLRGELISGGNSTGMS